MNLITDDTFENKLILIYTEIKVTINSITVNIVITKRNRNYNQIDARSHRLLDCRDSRNKSY